MHLEFAALISEYLMCTNATNRNAYKISITYIRIKKGQCPSILGDLTVSVALDFSSDNCHGQRGCLFTCRCVRCTAREARWCVTTRFPGTESHSYAHFCSVTSFNLPVSEASHCVCVYKCVFVSSYFSLKFF